MTEFWHGGGRIDGDLVLPAAETGRSRSGDERGVFVTSVRSLAEMYASTVPEATAWLYQVEPVGPLVPVPSEVSGGPPISFRCDSARIVARFTVPNWVRARARRAVAQADSVLSRGEAGPR